MFTFEIGNLKEAYKQILTNTVSSKTKLILKNSNKLKKGIIFVADI
jgi:hypothetical protein